MDESSLSPSARKALETFRDQSSVPLLPARREALWRSALATARPSQNRLGLKALGLCVVVAVVALIAIPLPRACPSQLDAECGTGNSCNKLTRSCDRKFFQASSAAELASALAQIRTLIY